MKKVFIVLGLILIIGSLLVSFGCRPMAPTTPAPAATPTPKPKPIKIRIIHAYPETTQHGRNMLKFKELAEKYTEGRVEVTIFPNASVCPITKEVQTVLGGGAEICYNIGGIIEAIDPAEAIWTIPYLFRNAPGDCRHIRKAFLDPRLEGVLHERQLKKGLWRLGTPCTVDGFLIACNKHPIKTLEDFKGLKMRHPGGIMGPIFFDKLGCSAITVPGTEVPVALETGVVDGLTTVPLHYFDARWITKYVTIAYWNTYSLPLLANLEWWNSLPKDIQDIITNKVMPELMEYSFSEVEKRTPKVIEEIQKPPYNVEVYYPPKEEIKRWRDATQPACIEKFKELVGEELAMSMINAAKELTPPDMVLD